MVNIGSIQIKVMFVTLIDWTDISNETGAMQRECVHYDTARAEENI